MPLFGADYCAYTNAGSGCVYQPGGCIGSLIEVAVQTHLSVLVMTITTTRGSTDPERVFPVCLLLLVVSPR